MMCMLLVVICMLVGYHAAVLSLSMIISTMMSEMIMMLFMCVLVAIGVGDVDFGVGVVHAAGTVGL